MLEIALLKDPSNRPLTTGVDAVADFTGGATDDVFNATMATMQSLDAIDGGAGKDTLNIRDTASITARSGSHAGIEVLNVTSTAGSVGQVAAGATIAARQQFTLDFTNAVFVGGTSTTLNVTIGGVTRVVEIGVAVANTATNVAAAIEAILDDALGAAAYTAAASGVITVTAATPGIAIPAITITAGTAAITAAPVSTSIQSNQVAADAVSASTFSAMTGATEVNVTAATTANVSSVSTAATVVSAGGAVVLSGGASQTVVTADSVQVSGSTGAVSVTAAAKPATSLAAVGNTGWSTAAAGVFVRGGSSVSVSETAGSSSSGSVPSGNNTKIQVGADPTAASGAAGANAGAIVSSLATGAEVIGNLSSAATGDVSTVVRTLYTANVSGNAANGLTNVRYGTGDVKLYMNGGSTASVTGASTVSVTDVQTVLTKASTTADALAGTSKLTTVNLTGVSGATGIKSDAIATVSAVDTTSTITVTSNTGANTGNVALNVANSTVTLVHANATSVSVGGAAGSGRQALGTTPIASTQDSTVTLTAAKATTLAFSGANTVTLAGASALGELTAITSTASGTVNLGTATGYAKLTSVNMSGGTGAVTATLGATITGTPANDRAFTYTGSAGADTVVLSGIQTTGTSATGAAIANTISLGAGNDVLLKTGAGAVGAGATVDGGAGVDTVAASLLNVGNASRITSFEQLGLDLTTGTYDTDLLAGATGFVLLGQGGTYTNAEKAQSLTVASNVGANATTIQFTAAQIAGSADAYGVNFAAAGSAVATSPTAIDAGTLVIAGIEDVTISSGAASGFVNNTIDLTAANLKTVTVSGAATVTTLGFVGTNGTNAAGGVGGGVTAIEAGTLTGKLVIDTTNLVVNDATGFAGLAVNSGAGNDAITLAQRAIVNAGAGDDVITLAAAGGVITLGAGADEVNVGSALGAVTRIVDFSAADKVDFINATDGTHSATAGALAKLTLTTETTLDQLFTSAGAAASGAVEVVWFNFGGNTYAVYDKDNSGTYTAAGDVVVRFDGVVDLTGYSFDAVNGSLAFV